jgi:hypothetical protein
MFLALLHSGQTEEHSNLAKVLWRVWTVRNKVTHAGEALSIDGSVEYLRNLEKNLKESGGKETAGGNLFLGQGTNDTKAQVSSESHWYPTAHA